MKDSLAKKGSTLFLKMALVVMGLVALVLCIFLIPTMGSGLMAEFPGVPSIARFLPFGLYLSAVPFFMALYQAFKLLTYVDNNTAFSERSVKALKRIKRCALSMSVLYAATIMPLFVFVAEADDAPGVVIVGMILTCAPIVVAVFAAVLERLLRNAIDIKSENDLVV